MFASRYFASRYFALRYFPKIGAPVFFGNVTQVSVKSAKRIHIMVPTTIPKTYRHVLTELVKSTEKNTPEIVTTEPTVNTIGEGEFRLYYDGTILWTYTKRNDTIYKTQFNPA